VTGRERIQAVLRGGDADRIPWVPFAGVHAGKLKGYSAREVLTDVDKLTESLLEVNRLYKPDGQPVLFDLQLEAEALGAELIWSEDSPPSVVGHPLSETTEIPDTRIGKNQGRLSFALEAMARMKREVGGTTALYGLVCGPFTLASHMRGTELFLDMVLNEDYVHALLEWSTEVVTTICGYYIEVGMDVIALVDPLVSQISPQHFEQYLTSPFAAAFDGIRSAGALSSFFVCGNATNNIAPMCETHPDNISVDENVSLAQAKEITDAHKISIGGNIPLTSVMLFGSQQDNMKCTIELLDSVSSHGLIVSPGCDMPYDIPPENPIAIEQAVHETDQVREMVRAYVSQEFEFTGTLPDYAHLDRPFVEVFTLNSATCAACTYMWKAAQAAKERFGEAIDIIEYPYTTRENIARCAVMEVTKLPSLYINGKLAYSSLIPNRDELNATINEVLGKGK
jgi:uroporphyrinogen decarboxylase